MPWSALVGAVASYGLNQIGNSSSAGGGGGSPGGYAPPVYQPQWQANVDARYFDNYNNYQGANASNYQLTQPYANSAFQQQVNNPYSGPYMQGAQQAGAAYGAAAPAALNAAAQSYGAGNQAYQTGFDPQGALYNQNRADLMEQVNAYNANNGIQSSPYGASVAANAMGRFQNDWQNQQLQRQATGVNTMNAANNAGGQLVGQGANMYQQAGQTPFNAVNAMAQNSSGAINQYYANQNPYMQGLQQNVNNALPYLQLGQAAQANAYSQNLQNAQFQNQLGQQYGQAFAPVSQAVGNQLSNWYSNSGMNNQPVYSNNSTNYGNAGVSPYSGGGYVDAGAGGYT